MSTIALYMGSILSGLSALDACFLVDDIEYLIQLRDRKSASAAN